MSILASRMAAVLRKALSIVAYEWSPDRIVEQDEKHQLVIEGERVLEDYVQRMGGK